MCRRRLVFEISYCVLSTSNENAEVAPFCMRDRLHVYGENRISRRGIVALLAIGVALAVWLEQSRNEIRSIEVHRTTTSTEPALSVATLIPTQTIAVAELDLAESARAARSRLDNAWSWKAWPHFARQVSKTEILSNVTTRFAMLPVTCGTHVFKESCTMPSFDLLPAVFSYRLPSRRRDACPEERARNFPEFWRNRSHFSNFSAARGLIQSAWTHKHSPLRVRYRATMFIVSKLERDFVSNANFSKWKIAFNVGGQTWIVTLLPMLSLAPPMRWLNWRKPLSANGLKMYLNWEKRVIDTYFSSDQLLLHQLARLQHGFQANTSGDCDLSNVYSRVNRLLFVDFGSRSFDTTVSTFWESYLYPYVQKWLRFHKSCATDLRRRLLIEIHAVDVLPCACTFAPFVELLRRFESSVSFKVQVTFFFHRVAIWIHDYGISLGRSSEMPAVVSGGTDRSKNCMSSLDIVTFLRSILSLKTNTSIVDSSTTLSHEGTVFIMKMDVEGAEFELIHRLHSFGLLQYVQEMFIECHPDKLHTPFGLELPHDKPLGHALGYGIDCLFLMHWLRSRGVSAHIWP